MPRLFLAIMIALSMAIVSTSGAKADEILGFWKTAEGTQARAFKCDNDICIRLTTGPFKPKQIGRLTPEGNERYKGQITDPSNDRNYRGTGEVSGNTLNLRGCAGPFCRTTRWTRVPG